MVEKLVLELRHIDVGRTLRFAGFALEAKIHHFVKPFPGEFLLWRVPGDCASQRVRATAGRMFLIERTHVRRTHRTVELLPTLGHAAAHLDSAHKAALA